MTEENPNPKIIMQELISSLKHYFKPSRTIHYHLARSEPSIFPDKSSEDLMVQDLNDLPKGKYDLIYADLPIYGYKSTITIAGKKIKSKMHWEYLFKIVQFLDTNGLAVFTMEPSLFFGKDGLFFEEVLNSEGVYVSAILSTPDGILKPFTSIKPILVMLRKNPIETVFTAELVDPEQVDRVIQNYATGTYTYDLFQGVGIEPQTFSGFDRLRARLQMERLETQYKEFEQYSIGELAKEINLISSGKLHNPKHNSIYVPKIGTSRVISDLSHATIKHHNYIQVVFNDKASSEYVAILLRSELGKLIINSIFTASLISQINKQELSQTLIPLPDLKTQNEIVNMQKKLDSLKAAIDRYEEELALNPICPEEMIDQLDDMLHIINELSDADRIRNYIRSGESKTLEFKESLSYDLSTLKKEKYLEEAVLKTIVGFLNTDGGSLIIGIHDSGSITGIDTEIKAGFKKNKDKYLLHLKNLIKDHIGEQFYPIINYKTIHIDNEYVLLVDCQASDQPCFLDQSVFYVRTNPATDKLEGPKLVEYVKKRFPES